MIIFLLLLSVVNFVEDLHTYFCSTGSRQMGGGGFSRTNRGGGGGGGGGYMRPFSCLLGCGNNANAHAHPHAWTMTLGAEKQS